MLRLMRNLWSDDGGAIIAVEWLFFVTLMIIGLVCGLKAVQGAVNNEFEEIAGAIGGLSQSYHFSGCENCCFTDANGRRDCCVRVGGSSFSDRIDAYRVDVCVEGTDVVGPVCPD